MTLTSLLTTELIKLPLTSENKYQAIDELVGCLATNNMIKDRNMALDDVVEREQYLSTGLENGLAVPHGKSKATSHLVMALGISKEGIDFDSLDGKPAHIIFLLLSPKNTSGPHIKALAQITKKLKDADTRTQLMNANSAEEILALFKTLEEND